MRLTSPKLLETVALGWVLCASCGASRAPDEPNATRGPALPHCEVTWQVRELQPAALSLTERCGLPGARWFPLGGPRGMHWDVQRSRVAYEPDWLEGGRTQEVALEGWQNGQRVATGSLRVEIEDVVRPPPLRIDAVEPVDGGRLIKATLVTDAFLDSPGYAGREVAVHIAVPDVTGPTDTRAVELMLHGFSGPPDVSVDHKFHVSVHDPDNTYWWGYDDGLPTSEPTGANVPDYTLRKALWALEWTLSTFEHEGADRDRVYVHGASMGGTGAATVGLLYARHFAWISAYIGQTIPRNHRPLRRKQLERWYGPVDPVGAPPHSSVWDRMDLTRVLRDDPPARDSFLFLRHGKDDPIIHFGAVVQPSPVTGLSFYDALTAFQVGHYAVWDESGHGTGDPTLPTRWWHTGWHPMTDATTRLSLDAAFPAFTHASHDGDAGGFRGSGDFDPSRGYAENWRVAGDTRWAGDRAGAFNRGLRWKSRALVDTVARFALPLRVHEGPGEPAPSEGEPCLYDQLCAELPVRVDVTLRRTQAFRLAPGERATWTFGAQQGDVTADDDGVVTVKGLDLTHTWETLELTRAP